MLTNPNPKRAFFVCGVVVINGFFSGCSSLGWLQPFQTTNPATNPVTNQPDHNALAQVSSTGTTDLLWTNNFRGIRWLAPWHLEDVGRWGLENCKVVRLSNDRFDRALRVHYPAGSASPAVADRHRVPLGGAEFRGRLDLPPQDQLRLSYYVRFSNNFDFVKGGKLPGLYGGTANSGGNIPDGTDGFSTRFMWRHGGRGEIYAYLPTSEDYGTSLGQGRWRFRPGQWHHLVQEVQLNQPGQTDGRIRVWFDDELILDQQDVIFRSTEQLKIDGIFFSTFFGGGDISWATPRAVYADFAEFSVSTGG